MSQYALPALILNMGGEMLYILEQRLFAQNIADDKRRRVLKDVISELCGKKFMEELFKPQQMYSNTSVRQIFDRLAHSSIMRLNVTSMDKLYDLMTMGVKHQVLNISEPRDIILVTYNHLDTMTSMVQSYSTPAVTIIREAKQAFTELYSRLAPGELLSVKETLCRFFQNRRVKVSLFLQEGLQLQNGMMVLSHKGRLPRGGEKPGLVRYFGANGTVVREATLPLINTDGTSQPAPEDLNHSPRATQLGCNLYLRASERKSGEILDSTEPASDPEARGEDTKATQSRDTARAELNLLASLIRVAPPNAQENFTCLNLFRDATLDPAKARAQYQDDTLHFGAKDSYAHTREIEDEVGNLQVSGTGAEDKSGDDLLDLLDST